MIKTYATPLTISIANNSNKLQYFVPHRENETFPVTIDGKVSFTSNISEEGLYYERQLNKDLSVYISESNNTSVESGSYDLTTEEFTKSSSFNSILESVSTNNGVTTANYKVIGTLPYSDATPSIGMPAGNRFVARLSNPTITSRDDLPSGKICNITKVGGTNQDYTKSAFETDGSLIMIVNAIESSQITATIDWTDESTSIYVFTFKDVKLGASGEVLNEVQDVEINLPATITLEAIENTNFIPYHENFVVNIIKGDKIVLEVKQPNEAMYYLLQNYKDLKVTL